MELALRRGAAALVCTNVPSPLLPRRLLKPVLRYGLGDGRDMVIHHCATLALILVSYGANLTRIGTLVLAVFAICEWAWLAGAGAAVLRGVLGTAPNAAWSCGLRPCPLARPHHAAAASRAPSRRSQPAAARGQDLQPAVAGAAQDWRLPRVCRRLLPLPRPAGALGGAEARPARLQVQPPGPPCLPACLPAIPWRWRTRAACARCPALCACRRRAIPCMLLGCPTPSPTHPPPSSSPLLYPSPGASSPTCWLTSQASTGASTRCWACCTACS